MTTFLTVTADPSFHAEAERSLGSIPGLQLAGPVDLAGALARPAGGVYLLDGNLPGNCYEHARALTNRGGCRLLLVLDADNEHAASIARFVGASAVLRRGYDPSEIQSIMSGWAELAAHPALDAVAPVLPESMLRELTIDEPRPVNLIDALADPETSLFNYDFLIYKLDEEYKRARRFEHSLSCVMLGFDGECSEEVLRQLSSVFLQAARDTDILGRFDLSSFLFLLPGTPEEGAEKMAARIQASVAELGLRDLIGDALDLRVGIASWPHPEVRRARDLYARARKAFQSVGA